MLVYAIINKTTSSDYYVHLYICIFANSSNQARLLKWDSEKAPLPNIASPPPKKSFVVKYFFPRRA